MANYDEDRGQGRPADWDRERGSQSDRQGYHDRGGRHGTSYDNGDYGDSPRRDRGSGWGQSGVDSDRWANEDRGQSRQSHRGRGPKNYSRSDDRICDDVCDRLSDDHDLDASDIEVSVSDREVTLAGEVESKQAKRRAEDCADACSGVQHVQNNLRVKRSDVGDSDQKTA